jgi:hypothetical protein
MVHDEQVSTSDLHDVIWGIFEIGLEHRIFVTSCG